MKINRLLAPLAICVSLALIPGSHSNSGIISFVSKLDAGSVILKRQDGVSVIDVTPPGGETYTRPASIGDTDIPFRVVSVLLPSDHEYQSFRASQGDEKTISADVAVGVVAPPDDDAPRKIAGNSTDAPVTYLGTGYLHGYAIASFAIRPFYLADGRLSLIQNIYVEVITRPAGDDTDHVRPRRDNRIVEIEATVARTVVNPELVASYSFERQASESQRAFAPSETPSVDGSPVEYVIITSDLLASEYQRLADWKTAKGVPTVVRTLSWIEANYRHGSDTQETIRNFIRDAYEAWGLRYVLLGGDTDQVPARYLYSTYYYGGRYLPADLYFAGLDGDFDFDGDGVFGEIGSDNPDLYAEVRVGRLPSSTVAQTSTLIDKIISYETPFDTEYLDKVMFLAEVLFPSPWTPGQTINSNGADVTEFIYLTNIQPLNLRVTRAYETSWLYPGAIQESAAQAIDSIDAGFNHVVHVGHGYRFNMHCADDNVTIPDADAMTNYNRFSNISMLNCTALAFDFDCLGEHLLLNPNGGAVSVVGANDSAFPDAAFYYLDEYNEQIFADGIVHIGDAFHDSRLPRTPIAYLGDGVDLWTHYIYTLLGDPEMSLFTDTPDTLVVAHADTIPVGFNSITVTVTRNGMPADSAFVCLSKPGDVYERAATNASGIAAFNFTCDSAGDINVVVTARNGIRQESVITVEPISAAAVVVDHVVIDDDNLGGTTGNGNGIIDAGEIIDLMPYMRNAGGTATAAGSVSVSVGVAGVSILVPGASLPALNPGETLSADSPWRVSFSSAINDERFISFSVITSVPPDVWVDDFVQVVHAPALEVTTLRVDDSAPVGDGNGVVTDGEEFLLFCSVKNLGTGAANGLTASISSLDGGATIVNGADTYPDITPLTEVENVAGFRLSETSVAVENSIELVVTDSFGRMVKDTLELRAPIPPTTMAFDASLGPDRMAITWDASSSPDASRYIVYRSMTPGGPYTRANDDIVTHTFFTDTGLSSNTRYYYVVSSVDDSGNPSVISPEGSASTNPPQLLGWPNALEQESSNSPVIGDIDGDGDDEIVIGNDHLYAWHHDGQEVRDGDSEALTWGVFSDQGYSFIGPAALASLDGQPGLEIVAAAHGSRQVFCFKGDGSILPGWPRSTIDFVRAASAVGDIDGDGLFEIIAIDQDAYMYAWHHDGNEVRDGDNNPVTDGVFYRFPDRLWWHYQTPALADLDNDGADEIIIGTQDSTLYVLRGDGTDMPGFPRALEDFAGGSVAVGDIDDDGDLEIIVPVKNAGLLHALDHDNTLRWTRYVAQNLFFNPSPALGDLTGDGKLETVIAASNGKLFAIDYMGNNLPGFPINYGTTTYTESSPVLADVDGDGSVDIILGDESKFINAWDVNGVLIDGFPLVVKDAVRGTPAVADLDGDGDAEIALAGYDRTVYVWDLVAPFDPALAPWPGFHGNRHRNGVYGYVVPTGIDDGEGDAPPRVSSLAPNYPNPFNPSTTIAYTLGGAGSRHVSLVIYDVRGARVRTLVDRSMRPGVYHERWDGRNHSGQRVASGVYFYRLADGDQNVFTRKMVLLK